MESIHVLTCDSTWRRPGTLKQENNMKPKEKWLFAIPSSIFLKPSLLQIITAVKQRVWSYPLTRVGDEICS